MRYIPLILSATVAAFAASASAFAASAAAAAATAYYIFV